MNITFEAPDKVNGLMTITLEKDDYQGEVDKTLKDYRKRANIPGFRPGQAPMGMIKRQYGTAVKMDVVAPVWYCCQDGRGKQGVGRETLWVYPREQDTDAG